MEQNVLCESVAPVFLSILSEHVFAVPLYTSALPHERLNPQLIQLVQAGLGVEQDEGIMPAQFYSSCLRAATALVLAVDTRGSSQDSTAHHVSHSMLWQDIPEAGYEPRTPSSLPDYMCFPLQAMPVLRATARWLAATAESGQWTSAEVEPALFRKNVAACRMKLSCVREVFSLWGAFLVTRGAALVPLLKLCGKQFLVAVIRSSLLQHILDDMKCATALLELVSAWLSASNAHARYSSHIHPTPHAPRPELHLTAQDPILEQLFYLCKRVLGHASCAHRCVQEVHPPAPPSSAQAPLANRATPSQHNRGQLTMTYGISDSMGFVLPPSALGLTALVLSASSHRLAAVESTVASYVLPRTAQAPGNSDSNQFKRARGMSSSAAASTAADSAPPRCAVAGGGSTPARAECSIEALTHAALWKLSKLAGHPAKPVSRPAAGLTAGAGSAASASSSPCEGTGKSSEIALSTLPYLLQTGEVALTAAETCTLLALVLAAHPSAQMEGGVSGPLLSACCHVLQSARQLPNSVLLAVVHLLAALRTVSNRTHSLATADLRRVAASARAKQQGVVANLTVRAAAGDAVRMRGLVQKRGGLMAECTLDIANATQAAQALEAASAAAKRQWASVARVLRAAVLPHVSSQRDSASHHALSIALHTYADVLSDGSHQATAVTQLLSLAQARTDLGTGSTFLDMLHALDHVLQYTASAGASPPAPAPAGNSWGMESDELLLTARTLASLPTTACAVKPDVLGFDAGALHEDGFAAPDRSTAAGLHWRLGGVSWVAARLLVGFKAPCTSKTAMQCQTAAVAAAGGILKLLQPLLYAHSARLHGGGGVLDGVAAAGADLGLSNWLSPPRQAAFAWGQSPFRAGPHNSSAAAISSLSLLDRACPAMWTHSSGLVRKLDELNERSGMQSVLNAHQGGGLGPDAACMAAALIAAVLRQLAEAALSPFWGSAAAPKAQEIQTAAIAMRFACCVLPAVHVLSGSCRAAAADGSTGSVRGQYIFACAVASTSALASQVASKISTLQAQDHRSAQVRSVVLGDCRGALFHMHQWQCGSLLQVKGAAAVHPLGVLGGGMPACLVRDSLALVRAAYLCDVQGLAPSVTSGCLSPKQHEAYCTHTQRRFQSLHRHADSMVQASADMGAAARQHGAKMSSQMFTQSAVASTSESDLDFAAGPTSTQSGSGTARAGAGDAVYIAPYSPCFVLACDMLCLGHMMLLLRGGVVDPQAAWALRCRWEVPLAAARAAQGHGVELDVNQVLLPSCFDAGISSQGFCAQGTASLADVALDAVSRNRLVLPCDVAAVCAAVSAASLGHQLLTEHWTRQAVGATVAAAAAMLSIEAPEGLSRLDSSLLALSVAVSLRCKATNSSFGSKLFAGGLHAAGGKLWVKLGIRAELAEPSPPPTASPGATADDASQDSDLDISIVQSTPAGPRYGGSWLLPLDAACTAAHNRFKGVAPVDTAAAEGGGAAGTAACAIRVSTVDHTSLALISEAEATESRALAARVLHGLDTGHHGQWLSSWRAAAVISQCDINVMRSVRADRAFAPTFQELSWEAQRTGAARPASSSFGRQTSLPQTPEFCILQQAACATQFVAFTAVGFDALQGVLGHWEAVAAHVLSYEQGLRRFPEQEMAARVWCALQTHVAPPLTARWSRIGARDRQLALTGGTQQAPVSPPFASPVRPAWAPALIAGMFDLWEAVMEMGNGPEEVWSFCGVSEPHQPGCVDAAHGEHSLYAMCFAMLARSRLHSFSHTASSRISAAGLLTQLLRDLPRVAHSHDLWVYNVQDGLALAAIHAGLIGGLQALDVTAVECSEDGSASQARWIAHWVLLALASGNAAPAIAALPAFRQLSSLRSLAHLDAWNKQAPPTHVWPLVRPRIETPQPLCGDLAAGRVQGAIAATALAHGDGTETAKLERGIKALNADHGVIGGRESFMSAEGSLPALRPYCLSLGGCEKASLCGPAVGASASDNGPSYRPQEVLLSPSKSKKIAPGFVETDGALVLALCSAAIAIASAGHLVQRPGKLSDACLYAACLQSHGVVGACVRRQLSVSAGGGDRWSSSLRRNATAVIAAFLLSTGCSPAVLPNQLLGTQSWVHLMGAFATDVLHAVVICSGVAALAKNVGAVPANRWHGPLLLVKVIHHQKQRQSARPATDAAALPSVLALSNAAVLQAESTGAEGQLLQGSMDKPMHLAACKLISGGTARAVDFADAFKTVVDTFVARQSMQGPDCIPGEDVLAGLGDYIAATNNAEDNDPWQEARITCAQALIQPERGGYAGTSKRLLAAVQAQLASLVVWGKLSLKETQQMLGVAMNAVLDDTARACGQEMPPASLRITTFQFVSSVNSTQGKLLAQILMHSSDPCPVFSSHRGSGDALVAMATIYAQARKRADLEVDERKDVLRAWPSMLVRLTAAEIGAWVSAAVYCGELQYNPVHLQLLQSLHSATDFHSVLRTWGAAAKDVGPSTVPQALTGLREAMEDRSVPLLARISGTGVVCQAIFEGLDSLRRDLEGAAPSIGGPAGVDTAERVGMSAANALKTARAALQLVVEECLLVAQDIPLLCAADTVAPSAGAVVDLTSWVACASWLAPIWLQATHVANAGLTYMLAPALVVAPDGEAVSIRAHSPGLGMGEGAITRCVDSISGDLLGMLQLGLVHWPKASADLANVAIASVHSDQSVSAQDAARLAGSHTEVAATAQLPVVAAAALQAGLAQAARSTLAAVSFEYCSQLVACDQAPSRIRAVIVQAARNTGLTWPKSASNPRWREGVCDWFWQSAQDRFPGLRPAWHRVGERRGSSSVPRSPVPPTESAACPLISELGAMAAPGVMLPMHVQAQLRSKVNSVVSKQLAQRVAMPVAGTRGTPSLSVDSVCEGLVQAAHELQDSTALAMQVSPSDDMQTAAGCRQNDTPWSVVDTTTSAVLAQAAAGGSLGRQRVHSLSKAIAGLLRSMQNTLRASGVGLSAVREAARQQLWRLHAPECMHAMPVPKVEEARTMFSLADCVELVRDDSHVQQSYLSLHAGREAVWRAAAVDGGAMWQLLLALAGTVLAGSPPAQVVFSLYSAHRCAVDPWSLLPLVVSSALHVAAVAACSEAASGGSGDAATAGGKRKRRRSSSEQQEAGGMLTAFKATPGLLADTGMHRVQFAQRIGLAVEAGMEPADTTPSSFMQAHIQVLDSEGGKQAIRAGSKASPKEAIFSNQFRDSVSTGLQHLLQEALAVPGTSSTRAAIVGVLKCVEQLRVARGNISHWLLTYQGAQAGIASPQWLAELEIADPYPYMQNLSLDVSYALLLRAAAEVGDDSACDLCSDLLLQHACGRRRDAHSGIVAPSAILSVLHVLNKPTSGAMQAVLAARTDFVSQPQAETHADLGSWADLEAYSPHVEPVKNVYGLFQLTAPPSAGLVSLTDLGQGGVGQLTANLVKSAAEPLVRFEEVGTQQHLQRIHYKAMQARLAFDGALSSGSSRFSALDALLDDVRLSAQAVLSGVADGAISPASDAVAYALSSIGQAVTLHGCLAPRSASGIEFGLAAKSNLPDAVRNFKREAILRRGQREANQTLLQHALRASAVDITSDAAIKPGEVASGAVGLLQAALFFAESGDATAQARAAINVALARAHSCVAEYTEEVVVSIQAHNSSEVGRMLAAAAASRAASYDPQLYQRAHAAYNKRLSTESFCKALQLDQPVRPQDYLQSLKRLGRQVAADEAAELARTSTYTLCLTAALYHSARALSANAAAKHSGGRPLSYDQRLQLSFRFVGLWMNHFSRASVVQVLSGVLDSIPVCDLLPLMPQLTSQLGCGLTGTPLQTPPPAPLPVVKAARPLALEQCEQDETYASLIETLLLRMAYFAPYEVVPRLAFVSQYDFDCVATAEVSSKRESALRVLQALRGASADHADIVQVISETFEAYTAIAFQDHRTDQALKQLTKLSLSSVSMLHDRRAKVSSTFRRHRKTHATGVQWNRLLPVLTQGAESRGELPGMRLTPALQWVGESARGPPAVSAEEGGAATLPGGTPLPNLWVQSTEEQYTTMGSGITKPKRLNHTGSDGVQYSIIFKGPNDDMRQDATMMQLFCVINAFLASSAVDRSNLKLRTYGVIPLSQRCGMVQMVKHTCAFNAAVVPLHNIAAMQGEMSVSDARRMIGKAATDDRPNAVCRGAAAPSTSASELPAHMYANRLTAYNKVCESVLPKFHLWFLQRYCSAAAWQAATTSFRRTLASSSIAGYIAGVGDRHTSNILLDTRSGELVHIDFGVVFDAGKLLPTPETIPFRLTRDLVDGLGALGVEGGMRQEAVATLEAVRSNKRALCTVASVMVHDPLFTWTLVQHQEGEDQMAASARGSVNGAAAYGQTERLNPDALSVVSRIEEKILGLDSDMFAPAVRPPSFTGAAADRSSDVRSCENHVRQLIAAAVDEHRLCRLFAGWMAFL